MSLITAEQVTDLLGAVEDFDPEVWTVERILEYADNVAQPYFEDVLCHRSFGAAKSYTESLDGTGTYDLRLSYTPIASVTALTIDDEVQNLSDVNVYVYKTRIAMDSVFPVGRQNIVVTYTAGFASVPKPVSNAIALLCAMGITCAVGTDSGLTSSAITAGPISLREAFGTGGSSKNGDKVKAWSKDVLRIARAYGKYGVIGQPRKLSHTKVYYPRTDTWM